jgi:hypothetical protein
MKPIKTLMLALLVSFGGTVHAQGALVGVRSIGILVEDLDNDAQRCGVTKDALDAAVRLPMSNSRIKFLNGMGPYLYVRASFMVLSSSTCVASYSLSFNKFIPSEKDTGEFWGRGGMTSGSSSYVSQSVNDKIEGLTKQFIAAWLKANPQ